jgi:hypothetical protein
MTCSIQNSKTDGIAFVASDNSYDNGNVLIVFVRCASDDAQCILNSTCLYHICISKVLFSTYEPVQNRCTIQMCDNTPCDIVGMSTVWIRMFDGIVCILIEM